MEVKSYACPTCGAAMEFDVIEQKMSCSHCGTKMAVYELENYYQNIANQYFDDNVESTGQQKDSSQTMTDNVFSEENFNGNFKVYRCSSCGAEVFTDDYTVATFCSFCGRPSLMEDRLTGALMPQYVIPFKIEKENAVNTYKRWAKKGKFTPTELKKQATIDKITGMYVPFWLYDYNALIDLRANCTRVRHHIRGEYEITDTDHYLVERRVEAEYDMVPADASEKMPDAMMDKLEPFIYSDMVKFEMPYLSGYYSERFNYTSTQMKSRIENRISSYIDGTGRDTITPQNYSTVNVMYKNINLRNIRASYALLPVWILNYTYKGVEHMFTLNGQTGKIVADRPVSKGKMAGWFSGITVVVFAILMMLGRFFGR